MKLRTRLASAVLAAGLVMTPLVATTSPASSVAAPVKASAEVIEKAANWLSGQFTDDQYLTGFDGTSPDPGNTIDGVLALVAADAHSKTVHSATQWVSGQAPAYAVNPASAARMTILADAVGKDPISFGGVDLLAAMEGALGDAEANPYSLALLVIALERVSAEVPATVTDALLATQDPSGAFGFPGYGIDPDATAIAAQALLQVHGDQPAADAAKKAVDWLVANQCTEASEMCPTPGAYWGSFSPANTSGLAIPALRLAGVDTTDQVAWLVSQQEADGGFPPAIGAGYSDAYATAQALIGLSGSDLATVGKGSAYQPQPDRDTGNPIGWIIGAGFVVVLVIGAVAVIYFSKRKRQQ